MRLALVLTLLTAPAFASAAPMGRFGDAGTISPSGGVAVSYTSNAPFNRTSILFAPTVFYFVVDGVAVGGGVGVAYFKNSGNSAVTAFSVAPAFGYNLRLADNISLFPTSASPSPGPREAPGPGTTKLSSRPRCSCTPATSSLE